jgi:hypothetical protein
MILMSLMGFRLICNLGQIRERQELFELTRGLISSFLIGLLQHARDHFNGNVDESRDAVRNFYYHYWLCFCSSAKLINNSLRHLSTARLDRSLSIVNAKKEAVYQMMVGLWVQLGLPLFPAPSEDEQEDDDDVAKLIEQMDVI